MSDTQGFVDSAFEIMEANATRWYTRAAEDRELEMKLLESYHKGRSDGLREAMDVLRLIGFKTIK
jgi:hypothetical protein